MPLQFIRTFVKLESSAGIILFFAALMAIVINHSPFTVFYHHLLGGQKNHLLFFINDGLMTIFFLLVGLEIKREMCEGELNSISKAILPGIAAVGGMIFPAMIYIGINFHHTAALRGWAIPVATDIAFSLGILSLLGKKIPPHLKTFLMALAIFDDVGAIIIIAVFYTAHIAVLFLLLAFLLFLILLLLNYLHVPYLSIYCVMGALLWFCILKSGVHATIAGVLLALCIPMHSQKISPLKRLEQYLHPVVAFVILPLFAFANAGISFVGVTLPHFYASEFLGIVLGLFLGKQIGIWLFTFLAVRCRIAKLPADITLMGVYGIALIAGVGFTMSLFIGLLAFHSHDSYLTLLRMGVMVGSLLSGLSGYFVLRRVYFK